MKSLFPFRILRVVFVLAACLAIATQAAAAPPPAPLPTSPAEGSTITIPVFTWQASTGAARYEIEVGPQSDPNTVYWSAETVNLSLTPANANQFANMPLYWRVRGKDGANVAGAWSSRVNFTKIIPAPVLVSPANGASLVEPVLEWQSVPGAVEYKVELSTASNFLVVEATYNTYHTEVLPLGTLPHGVHYWRVSGVDPDGHVGTASAGWWFTKDIPAPVLTSPYNGHPSVNTINLEWQPADGAASYKVEISAFSTFAPVEETYTTYNTRLTPINTTAHGTHYWRVSGVDADGHVGTPSSGWSYTKSTNGPALINPGGNATITTPTMEWTAVDDAAYYKVEISQVQTFVPPTASYTTYNLRITPVNALAPGTYYWRVSGVDAGGQVGANNWRIFTLNALPAAVDPTPLLLSPADGATISEDPTFSWSRVIGADHYRLVVSEYADFHTTFESVYPDYASYTPYSAGSHEAYPNGTYYWKVEARNASNVVIATSAARSFTRQQPFALLAPADGATGLIVDPTFQWSPLVGADHYHLVVSVSPGFVSTYDSLYPEYLSYTPYSAGSHKTYPNGTYYWKVEARNSNNVTITTSPARSFTKSEPFPLVAPADGATGLVVDPGFDWNKVEGADHYHLLVSQFANFQAIYESVYPDYTGYTPYSAGAHEAYPNGTYYWKVEARNSNSVVITTSAARSYTKQEPVLLVAPANTATGLLTDPTFQWQAVAGADHYHLLVSQFADFHTTYDSVYPDYTSYTPYTVGLHETYANGTYFWKVEAVNSNNVVMATSNVWSFSKGMDYRLYLPFSMR